MHVKIGSDIFPIMMVQALLITYSVHWVATLESISSGGWRSDVGREKASGREGTLKTIRVLVACGHTSILDLFSPQTRNETPDHEPAP